MRYPTSALSITTAVALLACSAVGVAAQEEAAGRDPVDPVEFSGAFLWGPPVGGAPLSLEGGTHRGRSLRSTDARFEGDVIYGWVSMEYPIEGAVSLTVTRIMMQVSNEEGSWQGRPATEAGFSDGSWSRYTMVFDGDGGYEGLTAAVEVEGWSTNAITGGYRLRGVIVDGDLPLDPEPYVGA